MLLYLADDFLRAGTAVDPEAIRTDAVGFQKGKEPLVGICLMKAYIGAAELRIPYLSNRNTVIGPFLNTFIDYFLGNYVLVDTNHALTLDWFWSPRGPLRGPLHGLSAHAGNAERLRRRAESSPPTVLVA